MRFVQIFGLRGKQQRLWWNQWIMTRTAWRSIDPNLDLFLGIIKCSCEFEYLGLYGLLNWWFRSHLGEM